MNDTSLKLTEAVRNDLTPSLGVTEPGAIAYASACAARALGGKVETVSVRLNSGIYKNSFTCAVPGTGGIGCALATALGAVCGDPEKRLMSTAEASAEDIEAAKRLVSEGRAAVSLASISPDIFIEATVLGDNGSAAALIEGKHDSLSGLTVNGKDIPIEYNGGSKDEDAFSISSVSFDDILRCVEEADGLDFLDEAVRMDMTLFEEGRDNGLIPLTAARCRGADAESLAELVTCGAIEARVRGAAAPAMAITGSGSHGILCMLPVYAYADSIGAEPVLTQRAILLSSLITKYIKELSGLLSTACGCVLAGGTGAALGITYLKAKAKSVSAKELKVMLSNALNSMAASVTGMICHGGNTGCSLKAAIGVKMAFAAAEMAALGRGAESVHGILGLTPEETMRNMGRVACGMLPVESTIIDIMSCKGSSNLI